MAAERSRGTLRVVTGDGLTVIELLGRHDAGSVGALVEALDQSRQRGDSVIVDLSVLTAADDAVLHAIRYAFERTRRNPGRTLVLQMLGARTPRRPPVGLDELEAVPRARSRDDALALAREPPTRTSVA